MDTNKFEKLIIHLLQGYAKKMKTDKVTHDSKWTKQLQIALGELGRRLKYDVCTSGHKDKGFEAEWLYDMVWYKESGSGDNARLIEVPFVMESEWSPHLKDIKYDFEKLLVANARFRLMVCYYDPKKIDELRSYFADAIKRYTQNRKDDRYLVAILKKGINEFQFDLFVKET